MATVTINPLPAPHGPYPVFQQDSKSMSVKVLGQVATLAEGIATLFNMSQSWAQSKPGRKCLQDDAFTRSFFFSDGKLAFITYVEPVPHKGETHVADILITDKH